MNERRFCTICNRKRLIEKFLGNLDWCKECNDRFYGALKECGKEAEEARREERQRFAEAMKWYLS